MKILKKLLIILTTIELVENYGNCSENSQQVNTETEKNSQVNNLQTENLPIVNKLDLVSIDKNTEKYTFAGQSLYDKNGNILYDRNKNKEDYTWYKTNYEIRNGKIVPQYNGRDIYVCEYWFDENYTKGHCEKPLTDYIKQDLSDTNIYGLYTLGINNIDKFGGYDAVEFIEQESVNDIFGYNLTSVKYWKKSENNFKKIKFKDNFTKMLLKADNGEFIYMLKYSKKYHKNVFKIVCSGDASQIFQLCTFNKNNSDKSDDNDFDLSNIKNIVPFWKKSEYEKDLSNTSNIIPKYTKNDGTCVDIYLIKKTVNVSPVTNTISKSKDAIIKVLGPQYKNDALEITVIDAINKNKDAINTINSKIGTIGQNEESLVTRINNINTTINDTKTKGTLAYQVNSINTAINGTSTNSDSLAKQIENINSTVGTLGTKNGVAESPLTTQISNILETVGSIKILLEKLINKEQSNTNI